MAQTFTALYTFDSVNYANGSGPAGTLAMDGNGVLYGVTSLGGTYTNCFDGPGSDCGTAYALTPPASPGGAWTETVLWSFGASASDGADPNGVVMGRNGVLYGTTTYGGQNGCGAVFSPTPPSTPGGADYLGVPSRRRPSLPLGTCDWRQGRTLRNGSERRVQAPRRRLLAKPARLARRSVGTYGALGLLPRRGCRGTIPRRGSRWVRTGCSTARRLPAAADTAVWSPPSRRPALPAPAGRRRSSTIFRGAPGDIRRHCRWELAGYFTARQFCLPPRRSKVEPYSPSRRLRPRATRGLKRLSGSSQTSRVRA